MKDRLNTKERLLRNMGISDGCCILCKDNAETISHLFFQCNVSASCFLVIKDWLQIRTGSRKDIWQVTQGILRSKVPRLRRNLWLAAVGALLYAIWRQRNRHYWSNEDISVQAIVSSVKRNIKDRIYLSDSKKGYIEEFEKLSNCN